jgi:hypothetical protein
VADQSEKASEAAEAMKVTAQDLLGLAVIDRIVKEPVGGAHRDPAAGDGSFGQRNWRRTRCTGQACRWISCEASAKNGSCGSARVEPLELTGLCNRRLRA